jgi:hypothetical protein
LCTQPVGVFLHQSAELDAACHRTQGSAPSRSQTTTQVDCVAQTDVHSVTEKRCVVAVAVQTSSPNLAMTVMD